MAPFDDGDAVFAERLLSLVFSIRAGRTPFELEALLLFQSPLEFTFHTLVVLLVFGERSHQLVARRAIP